MAFSAKFPRTTDKSIYPKWEEIALTNSEEREIDALARKENIVLMENCIEDAKKIISDKKMKDFQTDIVNIAISLFEKRASHSVYWKERKAKEKFDEKFG